MTQSDRVLAYSGFNSSSRGILICTDVAARGIDLPDVTNVIQYTLPSDVKDYVHRIGRTARLGREGNAVSFILPNEKPYVQLLQTKGIVVTEEPGLNYLNDLLGINSLFEKNETAKAESTSKKGKKVKKVSVEDIATDIQMMFERLVISNEKVCYFNSPHCILF
jgi:ATP-dependent RNA helicase DDX31/DBP7